MDIDRIERINKLADDIKGDAFDKTASIFANINEHTLNFAKMIRCPLIEAESKIMNGALDLFVWSTIEALLTVSYDSFEEQKRILKDVERGLIKFENELNKVD